MNMSEQSDFSWKDWGLTPVKSGPVRAEARYFGPGRSALEVFDPEYAAGVDQIEAGERVSGQIRFAFQVKDVLQTLERALQHGAALVHKPVKNSLE